MVLPKGERHSGVLCLARDLLLPFSPQVSRCLQVPWAAGYNDYSHSSKPSTRRSTSTAAWHGRPESQDCHRGPPARSAQQRAGSAAWCSESLRTKAVAPQLMAKSQRSNLVQSGPCGSDSDKMTTCRGRRRVSRMSQVVSEIDSTFPGSAILSAQCPVP